MILLPILSINFCKSEIDKDIVLSFTKGWAYNFLQCFNFESTNISTEFPTPFTMDSGDTAPGLTPKFWNNRSLEPKDNRLQFRFFDSPFKSTTQSCSATTRIFLFLESLKYKFFISEKSNDDRSIIFFMSKKFRMSPYLFFWLSQKWCFRSVDSI